MTQHKCNRNDCPPVNVNGPKIKCAKCKGMCYLKCSVSEKGPTIETNGTVKKVLNDGTVVVMFMSGMAFVCCESTVASTEVRAAMKLPVKRDSSSKGKGDTIIASEINNIKELLQSIKNATDANTAEITEIKSLKPTQMWKKSTNIT